MKIVKAFSVQADEISWPIWENIIDPLWANDEVDKFDRTLEEYVHDHLEEIYSFNWSACYE